MRGLLADIRHALRLYRRTPVASLLAVVVLAVGMAFVSAFLSLYVDLALRPHAGLEDSGRLVTIGQSDGSNFTGLPVALLDRLAEETSSLEAVAGIMYTYEQLEEEGATRQFGLVSRDFFPGLRPQLHSGRGFDSDDHIEDAAPVAVISYRYWQDELGGADVLGTNLRFELRPMFYSIGPDGEAEEPEEPPEFRVVGIMAPEMLGMNATEVSVWLPLERALPLVIVGVNVDMIRRQLGVATYGRLARGASVSAVVNEIRSRFADSSEEFSLQANMRLDAVKGLVSNLNVMRESKRQLQLFLGASVLLALVAAANVSLFLLARAPGRRRELGIRMAVGAPMRRLARQLASESGLLVVVAALLGIVVSIWLGSFLRGLAFLRRAEWADVSLLDWRVLLLLGSFMLLLTLAVSLAPILGLRRLGIAASSRQVAARATVAQRVAGTLQIAVAGTLGGAAIAFGWYLGGLTFGYPGYATANRSVAQYTVDFASISGVNDFRRVMEAAAVELARRREAIEAIPGVTAVAFGDPVPGTNRRSTTRMQDPEDPTRELVLRMGSIDSRYIDVLGLRLLYGRGPTETDGTVAVVNQALAQLLWGRDDVVGEQLPTGVMGASQTEVIGVLEDLSFEHPSADVEPIIFMTLENALTSSAIIQSSLTPARLQQELERISTGGEIEFRVVNVRPLEFLRSELLAADRARGFLTMGTALLVVLLAAFGFYGTQRYLVVAGRREYAIRASLGAGPRALGRLVFRRGLLMSLPGLVVGALLAFILVAWLRDEYISRDMSAGAVTVAVVVALTALLLAASLGPARHARRTQPAPLLKED